MKHTNWKIQVKYISTACIFKVVYQKHKCFQTNSNKGTLSNTNTLMLESTNLFYFHEDMASASFAFETLVQSFILIFKENANSHTLSKELIYLYFHHFQIETDFAAEFSPRYCNTLINVFDENLARKIIALAEEKCEDSKDFATLVKKEKINIFAAGRIISFFFL